VIGVGVGTIGAAVGEGEGAKLVTFVVGQVAEKGIGMPACPVGMLHAELI